MALRLRELTPEEDAAVRRLAQSRTAAARSVERAQMIRLASQGKRVPAIAQELGVSKKSVRIWLCRFNEHGVDGLADLPRSGAPRTYTEEQVGTMIATVLAKPAALGLPFANWTIARLVVYLNEQHGIAIRHSRLDELLRAEGIRWRKQETWFGERVDPQFAEKRGPSSNSTQRRRSAA